MKKKALCELLCVLLMILCLTGCGACEHEYSEWTVKSAASCTAEGVEQRACTKCDVTEERSIAVIPHSMGEWTVKTAASCTAEGVMARSCIVCNASEEADIEKTAHTYNDYVKVLEKATCTEDGIGVRSCSVCAVMMEESIAATGHSWKDPDCSKPKICEKCGISEGAAMGHTWTDATCTKPKTCSVCGQKEGSALGHTWKAATCSAPKTCSVCQTTEGSALTHERTKDGTCKLCGADMGPAEAAIPKDSALYVALYKVNETGKAVDFAYRAAEKPFVFEEETHLAVAYDRPLNGGSSTQTTVLEWADITWTVDDSSVLRVENDVLVAVKSGSSNLTATLGDGRSVSIPVYVMGTYQEFVSFFDMIEPLSNTSGFVYTTDPSFPDWFNFTLDPEQLKDWLPRFCAEYCPKDDTQKWDFYYGKPGKDSKMIGFYSLRSDASMVLQPW